MRVVESVDILNGNLFSTNSYLMTAWQEVLSAISATDWPHGSGTFSIYPESGKKSGQGNGVKPIKIPCINYLKSKNWVIEGLPDIEQTVLRTGDLDAYKFTPDGVIAFEWETGNISSSHRAINKLLLTMQQCQVLGSLLVVPGDNLKQYLTDRIGNIGELRPYFPLWSVMPNIFGAFRIIVVEHDEISINVPKIPKGTDGRAQR
ncbi:hypothetical protein [Prosthecochloris sp.]|uniref:hypothetical protein n=1 Tax=Prosthecochloris sp. TaxID=290513 RepID=UPI0025DCE1FF|nr:hypothetical protein [Prosthecochloris sp.]